MFELPEYINLAKQVNQTLQGHIISDGNLGNSPHKFVWYNRTTQEFASLTRGKEVGKAHARGRWLFIPLEPGYTLLFGECGGKFLFHSAGSKLPGKYHLYLEFTDGSFLTVTTQMWGAMELYEQGGELEREYVKDMRPTPGESQFTRSYFNELIDELLEGQKRSIKSLLTQDQLIPGLGNASAQDIMFTARLHPRHPLIELDGEQRAALYSAIIQTVEKITEQGVAMTSTISTARKGATSARWIKMPSSSPARAAVAISRKSSTWAAPATCAQVARFECRPICFLRAANQPGNHASG